MFERQFYIELIDNNGDTVYEEYLTDTERDANHYASKLLSMAHNGMIEGAENAERYAITALD